MAVLRPYDNNNSNSIEYKAANLFHPNLTKIALKCKKKETMRRIYIMLAGNPTFQVTDSPKM